ncbi:hypothetical protein ACFE04_026631 [Oxalis oulophora]
MFTRIVTNLLLLLLILAVATAATTPGLELIQTARVLAQQKRNMVRQTRAMAHKDSEGDDVALIDCDKLYDHSEYLFGLLLSNGSEYTNDDARAWLSGVVENHRTCLDGIQEKGGGVGGGDDNQNLTSVVSEALALYAKRVRNIGAPRRRPRMHSNDEGLLTTWNPTTSKADLVVAQDGSSPHNTINEAVASLARMGSNRPQRVIIYVKAGIYNEKVEIGRNMKNVMFVGDGIDRTVVTGRRNVPDGSTTYSSATFEVTGDGFWARDVTFENTAGPQKHQAVALVAKADNCLFYHCSFRGYQDTLWTHSLRQFYRDCFIYGTIDFIFGNAAVVIQNCDIMVRRPMRNQGNMITAQGRNDPNENTGISIQDSRIKPAPDLLPVSSSFKTYLGRPWRKYSRTVILKSDLDNVIDPSGWQEWSGDFGLSTLYYAEYFNTGSGAGTRNRVKWPGYHVLNNPQQASPFTVSSLIQGDHWIPDSGVPVALGV